MDEDFFRSLEHERTQALVTQDLAAFDRLHAPDYELITPAGKVFSRERYRSAIAAEPFYTAWECGPMRFKLSERMALVRYRARLVFPSGRAVECWHMDMYQLNANGWQAVWSQATGIAPVPAAADVSSGRQ